MTHLPGRLGKYEIRRALGRGAMGVVLEGYDPVIDRTVAIKTLHSDDPDPAVAQDEAQRFLVEAKAAGRLSHRHIVAIYDYGEEGGIAYIVLEYVRGRELATIFAQGRRVALPQVVAWMAELLDALGYAHARGVVHRDVKPHNIFITDDGHVKLGDFGVARVDASLRTQEDMMLGTPAYMAPEQIRGEPVDARSDLYSAGVVLYQFLTGEPPYSGGMVPVFHKVLTEAPRPPSSLAAGVSPALDAVALKALAKAPDDRFATSAAFARALADAARSAGGDDADQTVLLSSPWADTPVPRRAPASPDPLEEPVAAHAAADSLGAVVPGEPVLGVDPLQVAPGDWALEGGLVRPLHPSRQRSEATTSRGTRRWPWAVAAGGAAAVGAVAWGLGGLLTRPEERPVVPAVAASVPAPSVSTSGNGVASPTVIPASTVPSSSAVTVATPIVAAPIVAAPAVAPPAASAPPAPPAPVTPVAPAPPPASTPGVAAARATATVRRASASAPTVPARTAAPSASSPVAASQALSPDMAAAWQRAREARARIDSPAGARPP